MTNTLERVPLADAPFDGARSRGERDDGTNREARQPRSDALPEYQEYRDEGCDLFASCLNCPLRRCRYDVPGGVRTLLNGERDHQIRMLRDVSDLTVDQIAARFLVSRRTVFRALHIRTATTDRAARTHNADAPRIEAAGARTAPAQTPAEAGSTR